ncbi:Ig-like domain-containing protein, partial [Shewanella baltica]
MSQLTLAAGNKQAFAAVGHYSDGSSSTLTDLSVNDWHTSDKDVGFFDESGVLTGKTLGSVAITATKDGITSNTETVTVTNAVITALQVTPSPVVVAKGEYQALQATATYSDGSSADVTRVV